jgi:hypothetical protein
MQRETLCEEDGTPAALLMALDDFDGWRHAVLRLRDDPVFAASLGTRAKALVSRRFALARMIDGFEQAVLRIQPAVPERVKAAYAVDQADMTR